MKGNTLVVVEELLRQVGAVVKCSACHGYDIRAFDDNAERIAYQRATNAWQDGSFGRVDREKVIRLVKSELDARNGPRKLDSAVSEILHGFQAAKLRLA